MKWIKRLFGREAAAGRAADEKGAADARAIAFVDYEYWYYSLQKLYHLKPDPVEWRRRLEEQYRLEDIMVFADFSHKGIREEISKLRNITNTIIETQNTFNHYKKDMTDFIMLDYIYQFVSEHGDIRNYILFTGDGHFQSVVKYLNQRLGRHVTVYGIKDAFSTQLRNAATEAIELPAKDEVLRGFYPMIVANLAYVSERVHIIPTFQGTVRAVAGKNQVPEEMVHAAVAEMLGKGLIYQKEQAVNFNRRVKVLAADWDALVKEGLWSYD